MTKESENLDNFSFVDGADSGIDFFGETPTPEPVVAEAAAEAEPDGEEPSAEEPAKVEPTKEGDDIDFFTEGIENDDSETEETEEGEDTTGDRAGSPTEASVSTVSFLKEKGLLDYELEEGTELTPELAEEILEDSYEESIENKLKDLFEELPPIAKDFNKFVMDGGDPGMFFEAVAKSKTGVINEKLDLSVEANQELIVRNQLKAQDYDDEYIDSQIEFLKDSKRLEKTAGTHFDKWKNNNKAQQQQLLEQQEQQRVAEKQNRRALKEKVSTNLSETEEIEGVTLSKADKKNLPSYMTDRNVKLDNGAVVTPMQRDLYNVMQDEKKVILLAKLLKGNMSMKDIAAKAETKVAQKVKTDIRRGKNKTPNKSATGSSQTKKSLADYF